MLLPTSDHKSDEHVSLEDFQRTSDQRRPVEDLHNLLLRISHHLDYETSERSTIYYRLLAIDGQTKTIIDQTKRRALRRFASYLVAICIGVAGSFAWQSYGEATKQIIATRAPELGWSPEVKQMIASWVQQIGLAEAAGRIRNHRCSAVRAGAASITHCADCARDGRAESARRRLPRPGAVAADNGEV